MPRLNNDQGAVAVIVAILMVPLLGFVAISIDIAATHAEKQQLQNGADAAALAIAQDCARAETRCAHSQATAHYFTAMNSHDEVSADADMSPQEVRVTNSAIREHWFAPVLGIDSTEINASATAGWGAISGGTSILPLAVSRCEFESLTGGEPSDKIVELIYSTPSNPSKCRGNHHTPGGFGWLKTDRNSTTCEASTKINRWAAVSTGAPPPNGCDPADFLKLRNQIVLLPMFDEAKGQGNNGEYLINGYVAFRVTDYWFTGQYRWKSSCKGSGKGSGNNRCLKGQFVEYIDQSGKFDYSPTAPDYGASVVRLLPDP